METSDTACESLGLGLSYASKIIAKLVLVAELLTVECLEILGRVPKFWTFSSVQFCAATSQLTFTGTVRVGFKFGLLLTSAFVHMYVY